MKKIYIAGSLFKESDINQRILEEKQIKKLKPEQLIYNPITADINDKSRLPTAHDIFNKDFIEVLESDKILVALDDNDLGVCAEIGIVNGFNFLHNKITELIKNNNPDEAIKKIEHILLEYPSKQIYAHLSDIRIENASKYEHYYIPYGYNQFIIGAILNDGKIFSSYLQAIEFLVNN